MKSRILFTIFLILLCGHLMTTIAQSNSSLSNFTGRVSSVDVSNKKIEIITEENSVFTADTSNAKSMNKIPAGEINLLNSTAITINEISVDDRIIVRGSLFNKTTINAQQIIIIKKDDLDKKQIQKLEDWKQRGITGIVKHIDLSNKKISVLARNSSQLVEVKIDDNTIINRYKINAADLNDFKPSNIDEAKEGDQIKILGNKSSDGSGVLAEEIFLGMFKTNIGKVTSVDVQTGEIKIISESNGKALSITVNSRSNVRRLTVESIDKSNLGISAVEKSINLIEILNFSPKILISDIKIGEKIAVSSSSSSNAENIVGLIIIAGMENLNAKFSKKSVSTQNKTFNLDVF